MNGKAKKKAVIVDDEFDTMKFAVLVLERENFEVHTATDGESGLRLIQEVKPDVAIIDIGLPNLDGLKVAEKIKNDPQLEQVAIIFLTSYVDRMRRAEGRRIGAVKYLEKPTTQKEFLEAVRSAVNKSEEKKSFDS